MNLPEKIASEVGYGRLFKNNEEIMNMILGRTESLMSYDTYQFEDYTRVVADGIDETKKKKRREEIFPVDCENAFRLGAKLIAEQMRLQQDIY